MANPEHVEIVKQGKEAIDAWQKTARPRERLNLQQADLNGADLYKANLGLTDLTNAKLSGADLRESSLNGANLSGADLTRADLSFANLMYIDFTEANLTDAVLLEANLSSSKLIRAKLVQAELSFAYLGDTDLHEADLRKANLHFAILRWANVKSANFDSVLLGGTVIVDCDMSRAINLDKVKHEGPSTIGIDTIFRSGGNIPEEFLRGAGVPEEIIRGLPMLIGKIQYYSCFIAYGEPDKAFAEQLHKDFASRGVNSWLYATDSMPGERTWGEIGQRRREAGKFVVICSAAALVRDGLLKEIEEQMDEDPEKIIPISRDKLWKEPGFKVTRGTRDLKPFLMERNYANFEEDSDYKKELNRLLKALERRQG